MKPPQFPFFSRSIVALFTLAALLSPALADEKTAPAAHGLALTFTSGDLHDTRPARLAALFLPKGTAPTPLIPAAGAWTAQWEGLIASPLRADYTFSADVAGTVSIKVNDVEVLAGKSATLQRLTGKKVQLSKGQNRLRIDYTPPTEADAAVRVLWSSSEFPPEPISPAVFGHNPEQPEVAGALLRQGRLLFGERKCLACHDSEGKIVPGEKSLPELASDAPVFGEFGSRFNEAWLAHWINDPKSIRPHTPMPRVFPGAKDAIDPRAADLAAYLVSMGQRNEGKIDDEDVPLGGALFANLGCIACHTPPEYSDKDEFDRVPLGHLKAKWQQPALVEYLRDPQKFYKWTRMPNFRLSEEEARRLAAFLLSGQQREFTAPPKGDAAKGAQALVSAGCLNCHAGIPPTNAPKLAAAVAAGFTKGCLAPSGAPEHGQAPDFGFSEQERTALQALAKAGFASLMQDNAAEFSHRQTVNLRCTACHSADGEPSVWSQLENDMAALQAGAPAPEGEGLPIAGANAPLFTWLGEKLRPEWSAKFIAGEITYKPRPWLIARMPGFGVRAEGLSHGLAMQHGFPIVTPPQPAVDAELAKAGETLVGENGGFNCTTCHGLGERPPTAVFEAPGINLAYATERLRKEYYHRWVFFPQRIDPDTKMPRFSDDEGKTPLTDLLDGKASDQFEAIRQYLRTVPKPPETSGTENNSDTK